MRRREFLGAIPMVKLQTAVRPDPFDQAAGLLSMAVEKGQLRAATLHVRQGRKTFARAFGAAKSIDAIFLIASITKPMTAAGVMLLSDRGALKLSDPVSRYLPEFQGGDRKLVTIRHLLTHTSGLPDQLPENVDLRRRHAPLRDFVAGALKTPLLFKPGARVSYQSMGILLAAEIAERVTGRSFPEFLDQEVFQPLGMHRTALGLGRFKIPETAQCQVDKAPGLYGGGAADTKSWDWNSIYWRNLATPWGGAHSTAPDIAAFLEYFLVSGKGPLKKTTAAAMVTDQNKGLNEPWGIGFSVKPGSFGHACSPGTFGHGGSTGTLCWADPAAGATFVVLTTLPADVSGKTLLRPVSDLVSEGVTSRSSPA